MAPTISKARAFDSSVLILFLNDALPAESMQAGQALISAIVRAEVLAWPGHTAVSLASATSLLDVCKLVPVDGPVADEAARIRRETGLKLPDALIAATALRESSALVTANGKDFRRVPGLVLVEA
ncbi:MAG: type II toxin-antitoxin system VapC family toxin [Rhodoferax sp.]|uniref:type II toxin-antitoxin system VapC family toxin n=1 Tax=Rhodoferax sp. TaxID=50421 RepID=UPI002736714E|nr:type II toxin-antitoxin system VapC family toxin [Rhodoferax sp.]MDP2680134.1 type II toxin-antitoxin system VapC family toxin [Rhodoferax sp.]